MVMHEGVQVLTLWRSNLGNMPSLLAVMSMGTLFVAVMLLDVPAPSNVSAASKGIYKMRNQHGIIR
jgi:hypothetical protein